MEVYCVVAASYLESFVLWIACHVILEGVVAGDLEPAIGQNGAAVDGNAVDADAQYHHEH